MKKKTNKTGQGEETMKSASRTLVSFGAVAILVSSFWVQPSTVHAGVCSEGTGLPPFLSSGADPNLLLLLDNSGSMLDLAYVDDIGECYDNSYDPTGSYAGLFDSDKWYKWTEGHQEWKSGTTYALGDIVYSEGIFYKAVDVLEAGASVGFQILDDYRISWVPLYEIPLWIHGDTYAAGSFVQFDSQMYYTPGGGTANDPDATDGLSIGGDIDGGVGVTDWVAVESTWLNGASYNSGDIVSDGGMLFEAQSSGAASGTGVWDDSGVSWARLDEGYFEEVADTDVTAVVAAEFSGVTEGDVYQQDELYIRIVEVLDDVNLDDKGDPVNVDVQSRVSAFAASGRLLNWASASKFDIQKKILTGGKFDPDAERLISQSRGCSGRGFVKEVPVVGGGVNSVITFSIRGTEVDNWIDTTDDTMRIVIMGVSTEGFIGSDRQIACQDAIDSIAADYDDGLGTTKGNLSECLAYDGTNNILSESNSAYNHSVYTCWKMDTTNIKDAAVPKDLTYQVPADLGSITEIMASCEHVYRLNVPPASITPENSGYLCYGVYNDAIPDAQFLADVGSGSDRQGYVGRCWELGSVPGGCETVSCADVGKDINSADWEDPAGSKIYKRCLTDGLVYFCDKYNTGQGDCQNGTPWSVVIQDDGSLTCDTSVVVDIGGWSEADPPGINDTEGCIQSGLWDYCKDLTIPEVIDPSDDVFTTGDTWGLIGSLVDSGIVSMFGSDHAIVVMKGYIKKSVKPEGVIHSVASDLRMGAMAFNDNGAETECSAIDVNDTIIEYCPDANQDGARVISQIKSGVAQTGVTSGGDPIYHVDDLTLAINDVRATAWTPLAEAVYSALGYYGQQPGVISDIPSGYRLNDEDYKTESEDASWADPVKYWCQENYLLIITEGSSTADINPALMDMITTMGYEDGSVDTVDEGECVEADGTSDLYGSTFLDDLTYFGRNADVADIFTVPAIENDDGEFHDKQNITTYIVTTGALRDTGDATDECNPATIITNAAENGGTSLFLGEDPEKLDDNLTAVLSDILSRASAGSAASVISSSRSGSGAVYQAIFWPELTDNQSILGDNDNTVTWIGDVHSLFMSSDGLMYEDTIQDGKLRPSEDLNNNNSVLDLDAYGDPEDIDGSGGDSGNDKRILFYYSENANKTRACYNITGLLTNNFICPGDSAAPCVAGDDCVEINDIKYLWSASDKLRGMDPDDRKIFTWNDANNDGIVQNVNEWFEFDTSINWGGLNGVPKAVGDERGSVEEDFLTSADWSTFVDNDAESGAELEALNRLISWIRGDDNNGLATQLRSRQFYTSDGVTKEWRLGDIIHSTPIVVSKPAEAYHYIYRDLSYGLFSKRWAKRRNMVYFGANDGMLHAVNGGFYYEHLDQFCCTAELNDDPLLPNYRECVEPVVAGECTMRSDLGNEMWAYIPYNLQPHLKCLANPDYDHKYFVDHKPRIFDVQIFAEEPACTDPNKGRTDENCIHAGGWGTILVGSMRFGGSPVEAVDLNGDSDDKREFTSSFFILDITNPEADPVLLGEMTRTTDDTYVDLNYTTSSPSLIVMRDTDGLGDVKTDWYLVMGNGPTDLDGTNDNDDQGKLAILPLEWLGGQLTGWGSQGLPQTNLGNVKSFRIPNTRPSGFTVGDQGGVFMVPRTSSGQPSYISDIITVDFDVENQASGTVGAMYKADAVYFGTTDGTDFTTYPSPDCDQTFWDGGGRVFRLVTKVLDGSNDEIRSLPSEWAAEWGDDEPLRMLVDAKAPITAAQSVGYDGDSFWVYAGTGRFYDKKDKTDDGQYYPAAADDRSKVSYFGIREPVDVSSNCFEGVLTWDTINWDINDNDNSQVVLDGTPGERGLLQVDNILVGEGGIASKFIGSSWLECAHCTDNEGEPVCVNLTDPADCFPPGLPKFTAINRDNDEETEIARFVDLQDFIAGTGCDNATTSSGVDGWYRDFHEKRERNLGQGALLGGLLTYTGYRPFNDICQAEGESFLYGVHFQTGTAWTDSVFGSFTHNGDRFIKDSVSLGRGLATTPSMHVGSGDQAATAFVQTSTGEIIEIKQENLPIENVKSGRASWTDRIVE
jgi:hypothetical protein